MKTCEFTSKHGASALAHFGFFVGKAEQLDALGDACHIPFDYWLCEKEASQEFPSRATALSFCGNHCGLKAAPPSWDAEGKDISPTDNILPPQWLLSPNLQSKGRSWRTSCILTMYDSNNSWFYPLPPPPLPWELEGLTEKKLVPEESLLFLPVGPWPFCAWAQEGFGGAMPDRGRDGNCYVKN